MAKLDMHRFLDPVMCCAILIEIVAIGLKNGRKTRGSKFYHPAKFVDFIVALKDLALTPMTGILKSIPSLIKKGLKKLAAANPILNGLIFRPEETLRRIGDIYRAAKKQNVSEEYSLLELYEDEEEDGEVEEAITMAGGNIQGYTGPLGREKEKNIKEQIEWMRRLELYHKKTTQRLK